MLTGCFPSRQCQRRSRIKDIAPSEGIRENHADRLRLGRGGLNGTGDKLKIMPHRRKPTSFSNAGHQHARIELKSKNVAAVT